MLTPFILQSVLEALVGPGDVSGDWYLNVSHLEAFSTVVEYVMWYIVGLQNVHTITCYHVVT